MRKEMQQQGGDPYRIYFLRVPLYVRRILHVDCGSGILGAALKTRGPTIEVYGIESEPKARDVARQRLDGLVDQPVEAACLPFRNGYLDCIILSAPGRYGESLGSVLAKLAPLLGPRGLLLMPVEERAGDPAPAAPQRVGETLAGAGLAVYMLGPWAELSITACQQAPSAGVEGKALCHAVWPTYDPLTHAREMLDKGRSDLAFEILCGIPPQYRRNPALEAGLEAEKQLCLLAMDRRGGPFLQLHLFWSALQLFYHAVELDPVRQDAYLYQAEFWSRIGDDDMAARTLRSLHRVVPSEHLARQIMRYTRPSLVREETAPAWSGTWRPRVLLLLTHERPHYGVDVLYDGLCRVLGETRVTEYPWKPTLHGRTPDRFASYPCMFNRPGEPISLDDQLRQLREGAYDLLLFADIERSIDRVEMGEILRAAGDVPLFVVDYEDDCVNHVPDLTEWLGNPRIRGYFKRELLACADFGPHVFPCPFAYADDHVPETVATPRAIPLFWAGQRAFGLRRLYLERMEALLGERFDKSYSQAEYAEALRGSRIGIHIFGAGFDCVRYWELPAHGCLLFSERPPTRIPHNFRDGETAVFFDDLEELETKLQHYLARPEEAAVIARAGHDHFKRHHTGSARARQVLGWIEGVLRAG